MAGISIKLVVELEWSASQEMEKKIFQTLQNIKGGMTLYGGCSCISWIMCTVYDVFSVFLNLSKITAIP